MATLTICTIVHVASGIGRIVRARYERGACETAWRVAGGLADGPELLRTRAACCDPGVAVSALRAALGAEWTVTETGTITEDRVEIFSAR